MKSLLLILGCLFAFSCTKDQNLNKDILSIRTPDPYHLTARLHRATTYRPRDGYNCGCERCFGICAVKWEVDSLGIPPDENLIDIVIGISPGKARIYTLSSSSFFESEFGVDGNLDLPSGVIPAGSSSGKVLSGVYTFYSGACSYSKNGSTVYATGYVDVDIQLL